MELLKKTNKNRNKIKERETARSVYCKIRFCEVSKPSLNLTYSWCKSQ